MAIKKIRTDNDPVLKQESSQVTSFNNRLQRLVKNMVDTMYDAEGIGLAAPQIGISKRVVVLDVGEGELYKLVNPEIVHQSEERETAVEACLSYPGRQGEVSRPKAVTVKAYTPEGKEFYIEADELLARALQHELDHLDGVTFLDRASQIYTERHDSNEIR